MNLNTLPSYAKRMTCQSAWKPKFYTRSDPSSDRTTLVPIPGRFSSDPELNDHDRPKSFIDICKHKPQKKLQLICSHISPSISVVYELLIPCVLWSYPRQKKTDPPRSNTSNGNHNHSQWNPFETPKPQTTHPLHRQSRNQHKSLVGQQNWTYSYPIWYSSHYPRFTSLRMYYTPIIFTCDNPTLN